MKAKQIKRCKHKFLNRIGQPDACIDATDSRYDRMCKYEQQNGVFPPDCWNLQYSALGYLYEHLIQYKKDASEVVDLSFHEFIFKEKKFKQIEMIEEMIEIAEFILMDLTHVSKKSETYNRLINNKYYLKYGEFNDFDSKQREIMEDFWKMWAIIFPAMWW